jgi:hypothetical protein
MARESHMEEKRHMDYVKVLSDLISIDTSVPPGPGGEALARVSSPVLRDCLPLGHFTRKLKSLEAYTAYLGHGKPLAMDMLINGNG